MNSDLAFARSQEEIFSDVASHYSSLEGWWVLNGHCSSSVSVHVCCSAYLWRKSSWQLSPMSSSFSTVSFICSAGERQMNHILKLASNKEKSADGHIYRRRNESKMHGTAERKQPDSRRLHAAFLLHFAYDKGVNAWNLTGWWSRQRTWNSELLETQAVSFCLARCSLTEQGNICMCVLLTSISSGTLCVFIEANSSMMGTISKLSTEMML